MVSEAADANIGFYFAPNNTFNYFLEGKPVWQIVKAMLIIALCTEGLKHRGRAMKGSRFCSRQLESSTNTHASSRAEGIVKKMLWVFAFNSLFF